MSLRTPGILVACALYSAGCGSSESLPVLPPVSAPFVRPHAGGFPMKARSFCSAVVRAAVREPGTEAIRRAAQQGANFTCGESYGSMPLDEEIMTGRPERAQALLEAGADPNARWLERGDRHPLQEALEVINWHRRPPPG